MSGQDTVERETWDRREEWGQIAYECYGELTLT